MPEPTTSKDETKPYTIPTPFGFSIAPGGLFDATPNNVFFGNQPSPTTGGGGGTTVTGPRPGGTGSFLDRAASLAGTSAASGGAGSLEQTVAAYELRTGAKYVGQTADGQLVFESVTGEQFPLVFQNGALLDPSFVEGGDSLLGGRGGGGSGFAPESYTTTIIGGQVYRVGSRTGIPEPTGVMVPPDVVSTTTDRNGNLYGVKSDGSYSLIQEGFDFAAIDPERTQAVSEAGVTGFFGGSPTIAREQFNEISAYNRANLAEEARKANLQAATSAFGNVVSSAAPLGQLGLDQNKFAAQLMREAPDYLARAFFQQGGTSPLPQVGQADVINSVRDYINQINKTLSGLNTDVGAFQPMAPRVPTPVTETFIDPGRTFAPAPKAPEPAAGFNPRAVYEAAITANNAAKPAAMPTQTFAPAAVPRAAAPAPTIASLPTDQRQLLRMEKGGHGFNMVITGDSSDGKPNEELVIDMPGDAGMAVIPMDDIKDAPKKKKGGKVPYAAEGGFFGFGIPQIPTIAPTTNEQLRSLEAANRPPAINQIMSGGLAGSPRFGFDLFTPQQIRSLTPETRDALGTTLATQFNETLENVDFAQQQRFGAKRNQGTARQIAGFI